MKASSLFFGGTANLFSFVHVTETTAAPFRGGRIEGVSRNMGHADRELEHANGYNGRLTRHVYHVGDLNALQTED